MRAARKRLLRRARIAGGCMRLVKVDWEDTAGDCGWKDREGVLQMKTWSCSTVGWIIEKTPRSITLGSTIAKRGVLWNDTNIIPKGCITKITPLAEV
ncbi:MAG: hypothetical protein KKB31_07875 [Nanoarchaeota archaeon]|nr:hypothetical protein [Nanoarchaeota archaeon]